MKRILATEKKIGEVEKDLNSNLDELGGIEKVSFVFLSCLILFFCNAACHMYHVSQLVGVSSARVSRAILEEVNQEIEGNQ